MEGESYMEKKKTCRISIRLNEEAGHRLEEAKIRRINTTQFINDLICDNTIPDVDKVRNAYQSICTMESLLEGLEEENAMKIREELNRLCRALR